MDLTITITDDNVVHISGSDEDGDLVLVQRLEPISLYVDDYRDKKVKKKRWWNL